jgi:sugar phosphate isomerase/epimerase
MDRRTFLKTLAMALACWRFALAQERGRRIENIGLQLYTVRHRLEKDFEGTLARVSAVGYKEVEFAGYFGHAPKEVRATLNRHHLAAPSAHIPIADVRDQAKWQQVLDAAHVVGHDFIVCPWVDPPERRTLDDWKKLASTFNKAAETSHKAKIQFAYHNHNFEFTPIDGKLPYDLLLAETDPKLVKMEMDLYWITKGGQDPLKYFAQFPGRFPMVHVKDMDNTPKRGFADVGKGIINFKRIFAKAEQAGIRHYFVENDEPPVAMSSIRSSFSYLQQLRF